MVRATATGATTRGCQDQRSGFEVMPGMNSGVNLSNPVVVAAFKAALLHQGLVHCWRSSWCSGWLGSAFSRRMGLEERLGAAPEQSHQVSSRRLLVSLLVSRHRHPVSEHRHPTYRVLAWPSHRGGSCCGSGLACCGFSTASCRASRRWRWVFLPRSSSPPLRALRPGCSTWRTWRQRPGGITPCRRARRRCGSRSGLGSGCWCVRGGTGHGWPG